MRSCGGKCVTSSPKNRMVPDVEGKSPVMQLKSVVLPAPLEPSTARRSPGLTDSVTSVSAASAPKNLDTPRNSKAFPVPADDRRSATDRATTATPLVNPEADRGSRRAISSDPTGPAHRRQTRRQLPGTQVPPTAESARQAVL